jgi:hypothetical protein
MAFREELDLLIGEIHRRAGQQRGRPPIRIEFSARWPLGDEEMRAIEASFRGLWEIVTVWREADGGYGIDLDNDVAGLI